MVLGGDELLDNPAYIIGITMTHELEILIDQTNNRSIQ